MAKGFGERPEWAGMGKALDAAEAGTGEDDTRFRKTVKSHSGHQ
jgi:hypothetical protein